MAMFFRSFLFSSFSRAAAQLHVPMKQRGRGRRSGKERKKSQIKIHLVFFLVFLLHN